MYILERSNKIENRSKEEQKEWHRNTYPHNKQNVDMFPLHDKVNF